MQIWTLAPVCPDAVLSHKELPTLKTEKQAKELLVEGVYRMDILHTLQVLEHGITKQN
jgi:hypothetical protein